MDGGPSSAGAITHVVKSTLNIDGHQETQTFFVTKLGKYNVILGKPWLKKHSPNIDFDKDVVCFHKAYCRHHCLPESSHQIAVPALHCTPYQKEPKLKADPPDLSDLEPSSSQVKPRRVGAAAFYTLAKHPGVEVFATSLYEVSQLFKEETPQEFPNYLPASYLPKLSRITTHNEAVSLDFLHMQEVIYNALNSLPMDKIDSARCQIAAELHLNRASLEDIEKALESKPYIDPLTKLPPPLHDIAELFDSRKADELPPHRDSDFEFHLKPGMSPPAGPLYSMSQDELRVLQKFLNKNLTKGFIRASSSPAAAPVLFAKKPGGGLCFCMDYQALNKITIKNWYPLPLVQETLAQLSHAKLYTKLDVIAAFNRICVKEGHKWMTAFNTRYGLFELLVMPFGLSNAPATFQAYINKVLHPFLDVFCTAYIDNILIYSDDLTSYHKHVRLVCQALQNAGLQCDIWKCEFEVTEVKYLGLIISTSGVRIDPAKVECVTNWKEPQDVKEIQNFLGFANFYRRFIRNFSKLVKSLNDLTKKDIKFCWSETCQTNFDKLKVAFISAPILAHFDPAKQCFVETDASDFVSSGILSQRDENGVLHPVAFMSKKHSPAECNYKIYNKELLAIVRCFEEWRPELQGSAYKITVLTDHRNLEYFMTTCQLS